MRKAIVESVTCHGCGVWIFKREGQRKHLGLEMETIYEGQLMNQNCKKSHKPLLGMECKQNNQF